MCLPRVQKIDRTELSRRINETLVYIPDIDFEPKYLVKRLCSSEYEVNYIVMIKSILIYLDFCDGNYNLAFHGFRWILQFIHELRKYSQLINSHIIGSLHYERSLSLYALKSLLLDPQAHKKQKTNMVRVRNSRLDLIEGLLTNILECTFSYDMIYRSFNEQHMISQLFFNFGETYETMAILTGTVTPFQYAPNLPDCAIRPQRQHLNSMVRKYILAATLSLQGDEITMIVALQKILTGMLLYGGVNISHLYFFYEALRHITVHATKTGETNLKGIKYANSAITRHSITLIKQIIMLWEKSNNKNSSCPMVLVKSTNEIVLVDKATKNEPQKQETHCYSLFISSLKLKAVHKTSNSEFEIDDSVHQESLQLIKFWEQCYKEHKGRLPENLAHLLNAL
ncbi:Ady4p Ecym_4140 [Eremothecium cymbalariae DBVPG|uniref:Uncharacterized protein n=1 Tax=Eremothecium cymbalariae (strain CBS 270.75 / DBVPG 7215 / KCTC 17166 / NRRL Y-17582) TaxID=931890 RepID=G8JT66_ERECY|nr:hypothetical protein Ecym_4140 [Eremothecium cymbalariae DBVPG\